MKRSVGQFIGAQIAQKGRTQAEVARSIGVSRAALSYVVSDRRELSIPLALKLESYFDLQEGELVKLQALTAVKKHKAQLRQSLCNELIDQKAFWSYANVSPEAISDEELIEKTFIHLDLSSIAKLFEIFPRERIKRVWRNRMAVQGTYLQGLNVMIALYYFNIKHPEHYLQRVEREHIHKMTSYA